MMGFKPYTELRDSHGWFAHSHLRDVFRFSDEDASEMVNDAMRGTNGKGFGWANGAEFTSHRGKRRWIVRARCAPFVAYTIVEIVEITPRA